MDIRSLSSSMITGPGASLRGGLGQAARTAAEPSGGFGSALSDALKSVSQSQNQASELQRKFQTGAEGVSLEETMVAMQKAQIGFQAALAVRNRMVSAYTDIMNMSV
ncbi:MAG: flagellar hook-basal body complex protein FliE [Burkholderiaceae bacterium]